MQAREALECCKQRAAWAILACIQRTRMLIEMWAVKAMLMRFQMDRRTLLRIGREAICVMYWPKHLSTFCPYPESLGKVELKSDGQIYPAEEISRQLTIQALHGYCLLFLAKFIVRTVRKKQSRGPGAVAHCCNSSYYGSGNQED
jgi:hypothetical protein